MAKIYWETSIIETGDDAFGAGGYTACAGIASLSFQLNDPNHLDAAPVQANSVEGNFWGFITNTEAGGIGYPENPPRSVRLTAKPQRVGWHVDTVARLLWTNNVDHDPTTFYGLNSGGSPNGADFGLDFSLSSPFSPVTGDVYIIGGVGWNSTKPLPSLTLYGGSDITGTPQTGYHVISDTIAWNPSDSAPDIALSNGNKTITAINTITGSNQPTRFVRSNRPIGVSFLSGARTLLTIARQSNLFFVPPALPARRTLFSSGNIVAVEIDLVNVGEVETLYLSNLGQISGTDRVTTKQFEPWLIPAFSLGPSISVENYGESARGSSSSNNITFALSEELWGSLDLDWIGRDIRVFTGRKNRELTKVYTGVVANIGHDTFKGTISVTDKSFILNVPFISDLYDNTFPESIRGKVRPKLFGEGNMLEPNLIDAVNQVYELSYNAPLAEILDVKVGGVSWELASGSVPGQGQWVPDLANGRFTLGSETRSGEVRCRARAVGWETLTTGKLMQTIAEAFGVSFDSVSFSQLQTDAPYLIGYYLNERLNCLDILDSLATSVGGWWTFGPLGSLIAGVLDEPNSTPTFTLPRQ